jgi:N-acetylglutamate synthase-like GNAT family acetyltransferase
MIECQLLDADDPLYLAELALRDSVLRAPQGRMRTAADLDRDRSGFHFVAISNSRVFGCLGLYPVDDEYLEMRHVAVDPWRRREGIASRLFNFSEAWAQQNGYAGIRLEGRVTAREFYEACGFIGAGEEYMKHAVPHIRFRKAWRP